jgi:hypothetical protein
MESLSANAGEFEQGDAAPNKRTSLSTKVHGRPEQADSPAYASTADYYTLARVFVVLTDPGCRKYPAGQVRTA